MTPTDGANGTKSNSSISKPSKAKESRCKWKYISKQRPRVLTFAVYGKLNSFFFFWKEEPVANCRCFHGYESLCLNLNTLLQVKLSKHLNSYSVHTHRYSNEFSTRHCSAMNLLSGKPVTDTNQLPPNLNLCTIYLLNAIQCKDSASVFVIHPRQWGQIKKFTNNATMKINIFSEGMLSNGNVIVRWSLLFCVCQTLSSALLYPGPGGAVGTMRAD